MPDLSLRLPANVPGAFYVDETCIDCGVCRNVAPAFFGFDAATGCSFVHRQPVTPGERAEAEEARESCPTESIGRDGPEAVAPAPTVA